jgi:hypothetical protein
MTYAALRFSRIFFLIYYINQNKEINRKLPNKTIQTSLAMQTVFIYIHD